MAEFSKNNSCMMKEIPLPLKRDRNDRGIEELKGRKRRVLQKLCIKRELLKRAVSFPCIIQKAPVIPTEGRDLINLITNFKNVVISRNLLSKLNPVFSGLWLSI